MADSNNSRLFSECEFSQWHTKKVAAKAELRYAEAVMLLSAAREREKERSGVLQAFESPHVRCGQLGENCARTEHFVHAETREIGMEMGLKTSARGQTWRNCKLLCTTRPKYLCENPIVICFEILNRKQLNSTWKHSSRALFPSFRLFGSREIAATANNATPYSIFFAEMNRADCG